MPSVIKRFSIFLLAFAPMVALAASLPDQPHIVVAAEGEVEAVPDIAHLHLQISETRDTASAAKAEVDKRTKMALNAAREQGVSEENIRASQIRVYPDYEWNEGKRLLRGQRVERTVELKLTDLSRYGSLLDGLVLAGITELGSVSFDLSNLDELVGQALEAAVANAKAKAEVLAKGFGRKLDGVFHVDESGAAPVMPERARLMMDAKGSSESSMLFGKQAVTAKLQVVFLLK
ncbi:hypothetical protein IMCC21906_00627 [Spongiibacter sp. IMCC21906]|uniref:SIMPL domain-containing protein n=1 Tax=Spongiibacter sp. IMCC21906 TaxID=1620392 RepID=UPI00062DDB22|nr:SIMPL domain-containing protein [Spongiibacter sp. IMCC21906]AKH68320.1 hypothetical protein IMCC21906_00627 [Spongiibacter sp. IMCC21906]